MKGKGKRDRQPLEADATSHPPFYCPQTPITRCPLKIPRTFSPCFQVAFLEPAPPPPTCLSWGLWGIFRRPLWWRWTQPLSSSASLGKQRTGKTSVPGQDSHSPRPHIGGKREGPDSWCFSTQGEPGRLWRGLGTRGKTPQL